MVVQHGYMKKLKVPLPCDDILEAGSLAAKRLIKDRGVDHNIRSAHSCSQHAVVLTHIRSTGGQIVERPIDTHTLKPLKGSDRERFKFILRYRSECKSELQIKLVFPIVEPIQSRSRC